MTITTVNERPLDSSYHLGQVAFTAGVWCGHDTVAHIADGWGRLLGIDPDKASRIASAATAAVLEEEGDSNGYLRPVKDMINKLVEAISYVAWRADRGEIVLLDTDSDLAYEQVERLAACLTAAGVSSRDVQWICSGWAMVFYLDPGGVTNWAKIDSRYYESNGVMDGLAEFTLYVADVAVTVG